MNKSPRKSSRFHFRPDEVYRKFSAKKLIGQTLKVRVSTVNGQMQHVSTQVLAKKSIYASDYVEGLNLTEGPHTFKVIDAWIMEQMNGGRQDDNRYYTYKDYFNKEKRQEVCAYQTTGLLGRIMRGGGNPDRISLTIQFQKFALRDCTLYEMHAPEEWYSDNFGSNPRFKFEAGFYNSSDEASISFSEKASNDIFGTRYFPVIVFPLETISDGGIAVRKIACYAKNCSQPIVTDKHVIFGTRCKPDEVTPIIQMTYESGGMVARAQVWDWD